VKNKSLFKILINFVFVDF